jgi:hypothetical protein
MEKTSGILIILLIILAASLVSARPSAAQLNISIPEFTLRVVDHSYDVAPTPIASTDPYTNITTTTTVPGYHVENVTLEAVIKNNGASHYNFRYKPHYGDQWSYFPFNPDSEGGYNFYDAFSVPYSASTTEYTLITVDFLPQSIAENGKVDVQVQGLFGDFREVPYGHMIDVGGPTYDFYFEGQASDWSGTQTVTYNGNSYTTGDSTNSTPSPQSQPTQYSPAQNSTSATNSTAAPILEAVNDTTDSSSGVIAVGSVIAILVVAILCVLLYRRQSGKSV